MVSFADKRAVIIDCGALYDDEKQRLADYIREHELTPVAHLLTHAHFDHCFGVRFVWETYGLRPVLAEEDAYLFTNQAGQLRDMVGIPYPGEPFEEYMPLSMFDLKSLNCRYIRTPGHTRGCVCYLFEEGGDKALFSGDTLFRGSIGRTDLDGGDMSVLMGSIRQLLQALPDDLTIFPGHGPRTTVSFEKQYNSYYG